MTISSTDHKKNSILKKLIRIGTMAVVPLPDSVLPIDEDEECWLEIIPTSEGILLKVSSKMIGSTHDASKSGEAKEMST